MKCLELANMILSLIVLILIVSFFQPMKNFRI